jgi:large subunit ribosomal protein L1
MAKVSKRVRVIREKVQPGKIYSFDEAVTLLKECANAGFAETVEAAINLGVDPRKSDQVVRGATTLPRGSGKQVRVAVFAQGDAAEAARAAGADEVGMEDLADKIKGGDLGFGVVIATPDAMRVVGALGQILGPRGLMPNPKTGTVTPDPATAVRNAKAGQVRFRTDKNGIIHGGIGKVDFDVQSLKENLEALVADLKRLKPSSAKGIYLKKITLSTTMGPGLQLDTASLDQGS